MFKVDSAGIRKQLKWSRHAFIRTHAHTHTHTHTQNTSVPALLKLALYQNKIQTSARAPLCHRWNWSIKPIIYIINNSLAFRYVTSQIWKYYGIFGFVLNERELGYTSTKLHFTNSWVHKLLRYTPLSVYVRDSFRISTWSLSRGFVFKCATHGIRCSSAAGYQTALHYCGRPFWIEGELPVFVVRPPAPNREVRTVTVRYKYIQFMHVALF